MTIQGAGFPASPHQPLTVDLGVPGLACSITAASSTRITCLTQLLAASNASSHAGLITVRTRTAASTCSTQTWWLGKPSRNDWKRPGTGDHSACEVSFIPAATPNVTAVVPNTVLGGQAVQLSLQLPAALSRSMAPVPSADLNQQPPAASPAQAALAIQVGLWRVPASGSNTDSNPSIPQLYPSLPEFTALPSCTVTSGNASAAQCVVPAELAAGVYRMLMWQSDSGLALEQPVLLVRASVTAIDPAEGKLSHENAYSNAPFTESVTFHHCTDLQAWQLRGYEAYIALAWPAPCVENVGRGIVSCYGAVLEIAKSSLIVDSRREEHAI